MKPNFDVMLDVLHRRVPSRVPFYEHFFDVEFIAEISKRHYDKPAESPEEEQRRIIQFHADLGFDYLPLEFGVRFATAEILTSKDTATLSRGDRRWISETGGPIQTWEDLENPDYWPSIDDAFDYEGFEAYARSLPEGMKIIGGAAGGPFEHANFLMGLESLSMRVFEDPAFIERLMERIGNTIVGIAERLVKIENLGAYRFGDDLGYKTSTMLSPDTLRRYFLPWAKKVAEVAHKAGKPFVLHSCGQLRDIMDDLIDDVKIDAKHSFEDVITPVTEAKKLWGNRVALLGGIDLDFICRHTPREIKEYTKRTLDICAKGGGYALGTGNSVTNYIPIDNYFAMLEAGNEFNGL